MVITFACGAKVLGSIPGLDKLSCSHGQIDHDCCTRSLLASRMELCSAVHLCLGPANKFHVPRMDYWSGLVEGWQRYRRDPDSYNDESKRRSDAASASRSCQIYDEPTSWALLNMVHYNTPWELAEMDATDMYDHATGCYTVKRCGDVLVALKSDALVTVQLENGGQPVGPPYELRPGVPTPVIRARYPLPMISIHYWLVKLRVSLPPQHAQLTLVWGYPETERRRMLANQLHVYGSPGSPGGMVCGFCAERTGEDFYEELPDGHDAKHLPIGVIPDLSLVNSQSIPARHSAQHTQSDQQRSSVSRRHTED